MKKEFFYSLCMLLAAGSLSACHTEDVTSGPAQLTVPASSVSVPADNSLISDPFAEALLPVTDTVWVSANRSWTAALETADGGDWVHANVAERINVTGQGEKYPLIISFDRYRGAQPRTAKLSLYGVDIEDPVVVNYTQEAFVPSLTLSTPDGENVVTASNGECYALVKSNTTWTVRVDVGASTVIPGLSVTAGQDSGAILVTFPENADDERARIARLVVTAQGCTPQTLDLIQSQSERYFMLASEIPEVIPPYEPEIEIPLRSNGPWTAELTDCTFEDAKIVPSSGQTALNGIVLTAKHGDDPAVMDKHATVTIRRDGFDPIEVTLHQRGSIHLKVLAYNPEYEWTGTDPYGYDNPYRPYTFLGVPFSYPTSFPNSFSSGSNKGVELECETPGGSVFTLYGRDCGAWISTTEFGLCVGKMKGDYVKFPGIDGFRLAAMYYEASCKGGNPYTVRDEEGAIIKGGEYTVTRQVVPLTEEHHDVHVHLFPDTLPGERYSLTLEEDYHFISIKDLCLVYEN
ncbi:MAG: BACON domain-containing protein [Bacteroidales bacterium]|nr:BACON domain-containing protein [Bacteroidales bacterium]